MKCLLVKLHIQYFLVCLDPAQEETAPTPPKLKQTKTHLDGGHNRNNVCDKKMLVRTFELDYKDFEEMIKNVAL